MYPLPKGFQLAVSRADFRKKNADRNDLALMLCQRPASVAGVFTTNLFKAAPVLVSQAHLASGLPAGQPCGVLFNSGQANACTGALGMENCLKSLDMVAKTLSENLPQPVTPAELLPASTGVIGAQMDMLAWDRALPGLVATLGTTDLETFTRAIMTTDAFPKMAHRVVHLAGGEVCLTGAAKGAGMICPNMATMLSVLMCDAEIDNATWQGLFARAVNKTFNRVSVDGDTSTNDSLYGFASGASGVRVCAEDVPLLEKALELTLGELAYQLVKDGEGATKVMHIEVSGALCDADAEKVAHVVGHSQLVKTAMYGRDPNWGRIVAAAGRAGVAFVPEKLRVTLCGVELFREGQPADIDFDALLREPLEQVDVQLQLCLGDGPGMATLLASDLSHAYVSCNADYRS